MHPTPLYSSAEEIKKLEPHVTDQEYYDDKNNKIIIHAQPPVFLQETPEEKILREFKEFADHHPKHDGCCYECCHECCSDFKKNPLKCICEACCACLEGLMEAQNRSAGRPRTGTNIALVIALSQHNCH